MPPPNRIDSPIASNTRDLRKVKTSGNFALLFLERGVSAEK